MQTDLEDVKRIILAGIDANVGAVQIARDLRKFYEDGSRFKAMRVARTEVSHGAGFGQREAARQSGVVKTHTWLTSRDDRVRTKHIAMEGQTVDFNDRYSDGSSYPGEIDIMCRCVESFGSK
jgi:SPP1 gp7 family putative phage head morphogenesis protein